MKLLKKKRFKNLIELNVAILFMSTSGVLGRYIDLPVPTIIATRALLASLFIFIFCKWKKFDFTSNNYYRCKTYSILQCSN